MSVSESKNENPSHIEESQLATLVQDPNGAIRYFNDGFARLFGHTMEEMREKPFGAVVHADDIEDVNAFLRRTVAGDGAGMHHEFRGIRKDGSVFNCEITAAAVMKEGTAACIHSCLYDITERKRIEQEIRNIVTEQTLIFDTLAEHVIYYRNNDMRIVRANRAAAESVGMTTDALIGKRCYELWHGRSEPCDFCPVLDAFESGRPVQGEVQSPDDRTWLIKGYPVLDDEGGIRGAVEITMDITELRKAERSLRESEEKYRAVIENASDGIVVVQDGLIKFSNDKAAEISGYAPGKTIGRKFDEFIQADQREGLRDLYNRMMDGTDDEQRYELMIRKNAGDPRLLDIHVTTTIMDGKKAAIVFLRDITEQRKIEEEILRSEQFESIGILAGGIAHDFNNILTAILGNITLAATEAGDNNTLRETLCDAEKAALRARNLTQQLLTFSKGGEPIREIASVNELLRDSANFALRGSSVRCDYSLPPSLWNVNIDKTQISQVIHNLVLNAVQAMPGGGVITIGAENAVIAGKEHMKLKPGNYVKISVHDEGAGIAPELVDKIFDPYFTTKHRGSGLGLTVSYSIIEKHGGRITLDSKPGKGSTFHIHLPATPEDVPVREEEMVSGHTQHQGRILLMDDEEIVRKVAKRIIENLGYTIVTAKDGAETLALHEASKTAGKPFDAIIMDLTIPGGMGGLETISRLRAIDPDVKAIVSSGYSNDPVLANYDEYGFNGFIPKPYKFGEMGDILSKILHSEN